MDLRERLRNTGCQSLIIPYGDMMIIDYAKMKGLYNVLSIADFELENDFDTEQGMNKILEVVNKNRHWEINSFTKTIVQISTLREVSIIIYGAINE